MVTNYSDLAWKGIKQDGQVPDVPAQEAVPSPEQVKEWQRRSEYLEDWWKHLNSGAEGG